jgi:hypothetical protein
MANIAKALFWFVIGTAGTVLLAGIMLFFFGQSDRLECRHQGDGLAVMPSSFRASRSLRRSCALCLEWGEIPRTCITVTK